MKAYLDNELEGTEFAKLMRSLGYDIDTSTRVKEGNFYIMYKMALKINDIEDRLKKLESDGK